MDKPGKTKPGYGMLTPNNVADMRARMADKEESDLLGGQMTDEQRLRKALGEEPSGYKKGGKVKAKKASKPKVRGAGKAMKGVRPAKMVAMKGA